MSEKFLSRKFSFIANLKMMRFCLRSPSVSAGGIVCPPPLKRGLLRRSFNSENRSNFRFLPIIALSLFAFGEAFAQTAATQVEVVNNQPFAVRMPLAVKDANSEKIANETFQKDSSNLFFVADLPASSSKVFSFQKTANNKTAKKILQLNPTNEGVEIVFDGKPLEKLSWQIIYRDAKPEELKGEPFSTKADFSANFQPLTLKFEKISNGAVFDKWRGLGESQGLQLTIELRVFHEGFLDINSTLKNTGQSKIKNVYAAVLTRISQPNEQTRTVCYDNRIADFKENDWTNFRVGESRNWYVQRGIDWLKTNFAGNVSSVWMNEFSQSFTVHQESTAKRQGRWVGANISQIGFEAQSKNKDLYILTEIARSNLKFYESRLEDNRLPEVGESVNYSSRLAFSKNALTDEQVDNAFVAYTSFASQKIAGDKIQYQIGVPYTRFGTNYFPYSTLGENFDLLKMPGMDRDSYWAFAADTVKNWRMFAGDIRRDLRIAKTLGFELIRLHHLEIIQGVDKKTQFEYLDFLFGEFKNLKLKALIDARVSAEDTAELVKRYRDSIDGVEVDNEVLIFGINDDAPAYWKRVYNAVKNVAPEIPVHLTAHTNTGAFDRIEKLGVKFDKIGQHAYADGLDSLPNMRGFSLAAASYGRRVGKEPIITEWNWRFLTRMTEEDRAKVYAPIFENVLKTRSMPTMYQFQFNETLAMNPKVLKGIRHYEQIWLSRRPKPEAFVLSGLIKKYSAPNHSIRFIDIDHPVINLDANGQGTAQFKVTNIGKQTLNLKAEIEFEGKAEFLSKDQNNLILKPNESAVLKVKISADSTDNSAKPLPGFYHFFLRLEGTDGFVRYGWGEARLAGEPKFDKDTKSKETIYGENALSFDLNRPLAVVYGDKSPIQDVETAYAIVNALESAIGRPVKVYELKDLPKDGNIALILVGTKETNQLIASVVPKIPANLISAKQFGVRVTDGKNDWLILSGADNLEAERTAMDWTLRFWKYAKDSGVRRVGLSNKELPLGIDPSQLP